MGRTTDGFDNDLVRARLRAGVEAGLLRAGRIVGKKAAELSPTETGEMDRSIYYDVDLETESVTVGFRSDYAAEQHENTWWKHRDGQAKFLEVALASQREEALAALAAGLRGEFGP